MSHHLPYAHARPEIKSFVEAVRQLKPTAIIGLSAAPKMFNKDVYTLMAENNERPVIFALSNPTRKTECTAEEAYTWTKGRAIFASGSPFRPVTVDGVCVCVCARAPAYVRALCASV